MDAAQAIAKTLAAAKRPLSDEQQILLAGSVAVCMAKERDEARRKALSDAARWVDEEVGHAAQEGWSVEALQALMATRDMLKAHADMQATTLEVRA
jgi:GTPase involved in cell partitioning and DNA repair